MAKRGPIIVIAAETGQSEAALGRAMRSLSAIRAGKGPVKDYWLGGPWRLRVVPGKVCVISTNSSVYYAGSPIWNGWARFVSALFWRVFRAR